MRIGNTILCQCTGNCLTEARARLPGYLVMRVQGLGTIVATNVCVGLRKAWNWWRTLHQSGVRGLADSKDSNRRPRKLEMGPHRRTELDAKRPAACARLEHEPAGLDLQESGGCVCRVALHSAAFLTGKPPSDGFLGTPLRGRPENEAGTLRGIYESRWEREINISSTANGESRYKFLGRNH